MSKIRLGKRQSKEHIEHRRQTRIGTKCTKEIKDKISNSLKGFKHGEETKKKMGQSHQKSVIQLTLSEKYIREFESVKIAAKTLKLKNPNSISLCCRYYAKFKSNDRTAKGFKWIFKKDYKL